MSDINSNVRRPTPVRSRRVLLWLMIASVVGACGTAASTVNQSAEIAAGECVERLGHTVVWPHGYSLSGDRIVRSQGAGEGWALDDSEFLVVSAEWARSPNYMLEIDRTGADCVADGDRWVALAAPPGALERSAGRTFVVGDPGEFDAALWDRVIEHPWRHVVTISATGIESSPTYQGVVRFDDQLAITSALCDTRPNVVRFWGAWAVPMEWPVGTQTMICVEPPGVGDQRAPERLDLPIGGLYSIVDDDLIIDDGVDRFRFEPITDGEFLAEFDRDAFYEMDPERELEAYEAPNWDYHDPDFVSTETTVGGD